MTDRSTRSITGRKSLESGVAISNGYAKFFIQYPGIFDFFFQEKANKISTAKSNVNALDAFFNSLVEKQWTVIMHQKDGTKKAFSQALEFHKSALHGILLFYLNSRTNCDYKAFMKQVQEVTLFTIKAF